MITSLRLRSFVILIASAILVLLCVVRLSGKPHSIDVIHHAPDPPNPTSSDAPVPIEKRPIYKPAKEKPPPIKDNFPLAATATNSSGLPPVPSWNRPPQQHVAERTPLFVGFTRNWLLLQQTVVSYITAGWPPEDIYVIENTGVMDANRLGKLSLQNPFYLDYKRLETYSVSTSCGLPHFYRSLSCKTST